MQAFDEGWGGVICKTLSLDSKKVVNVTPRYAKLRDTAGKVFGWQVREGRGLRDIYFESQTRLDIQD